MPAPLENVGAAEGAPADAAEAAAWAEVLAAWEDEARHRAYLARFADLEGLALAGRRYREALAARPGDALAARLREEVIRRATAQALATLPRSDGAARRARALRRVVTALVAAALAVLAVAAARGLLSVAGTAP